MCAYRLGQSGIVVLLLCSAVAAALGGVGCDMGDYGYSAQRARPSGPSVERDEVFADDSTPVNLKSEWLEQKLMGLSTKEDEPIYDIYLLRRVLPQIQSGLAKWGAVTVRRAFRQPFGNIACIRYWADEGSLTVAVHFGNDYSDPTIMDPIRIPKGAYRVLPPKLQTSTAYNGRLVSGKSKDWVPTEYNIEQIRAAMARGLKMAKEPKYKLGEFDEQRIVDDYAQVARDGIAKNGHALIKEMVINGHTVWIQMVQPKATVPGRDQFEMHIFIDKERGAPLALFWDVPGEGTPRYISNLR